MKPNEYVQVHDGEEIFPTLHKQWRMACCDCGLVHNMQFSIYKEGEKIKSPTKQGYRIAFKSWRNNEDTKMIREEKEHPCS